MTMNHFIAKFQVIYYASMELTEAAILNFFCESKFLRT